MQFRRIGEATNVLFVGIVVTEAHRMFLNESTLHSHWGDKVTLEIARKQLLSSSVRCPYIFLMS